MKINQLTTSFLLALTLFYSCSSGTDSTENANKANEERIDKQAVAASSDAKDEAKNVSKSMVELTNTSMTEYELSKVALQKATNPEVRSFAQQAMNDHQQDERTLRAIAKQMNVILPTELSGKSKGSIGKLSDMKAGTEFDLQYLDYMTNVNDDALDAADELEDSAPADNVKSFAKKITEDDKKHKDRAKQLKNALD
ncbi:DUF4142 domain-containing protein [Spirosoma soli]|uniref:DUF4142 domain-containing protein n=1 Tax=Spirosoma soli TaxID=1770529 RepID=A0ABW5M2X9_9BACT